MSKLKKKLYRWKVWLRLNALIIGVKKLYFAEISAGVTKTNADIADRMVEKRSEWNRETILAVINCRDEAEREFLVESAYRVQTRNFRYSPAMPGNWDSPTAKFDPKIHTPYINVHPTDLLRMMLGKVTVEVLGVKEDNDIARIGKVINGKTGEADNTAVRNEYVIIECNRSKVYPDDDNTLGVYFVNSAGQRFRVSERLLHNTSKMVTPKVPADIEPGEYGLEIVTRFSSGKQMLKEPRTIIYDSKLSIS